MNDGTKWEMQLFTDSQEALQFVAENAEWYEGNKQIVSVKLTKEGRRDELMQNLKMINSINFNGGRGIFPPYPEEKNRNFFIVYFLEITGKDGLVIAYLDKEVDYGVIFLDSPNIDENMTDLIREIQEEMEFTAPQN